MAEYFTATIGGKEVRGVLETYGDDHGMWHWKSLTFIEGGDACYIGSSGFYRSENSARLAARRALEQLGFTNQEPAPDA